MLNMCASQWLHSNKRLILSQKYDFNSFDRSHVDVQMWLYYGDLTSAT